MQGNPDILRHYKQLWLITAKIYANKLLWVIFQK